MGRRAYNVQWALPELVLDLPLYSASMEHMADRCGHPISGFGSNMAAISSQTSAGIRGIRMKGGYSTMPRWTFEPIYNGRYTYSYFFSDGGNNGHGWAWECYT
ncbi:MAG: hypothetical protein K2H70_04190, partial [Bacteroidales bacterium]|nr:hypothetical protein [Bacteroidales bacterium]